MRITYEMVADLGACYGAGEMFKRFMAAFGNEIDYDDGYEIMLNMKDQMQAYIDANNIKETPEMWLKWTYDLRHNPKAITYFNDHIVENTYKTNFDGLLHESLDAARAHIERSIYETRLNYHENILINGVVLNNDGTESWHKIENPYKQSLDGYSYFIWHDILNGTNNRTSSQTAAIAYYDLMMAYTDTSLQTYRDSIKISQSYWDNTRRHQVWVDVE